MTYWHVFSDDFSDDKLAGHNFRADADHLYLEIVEAKPGEDRERIGTLEADRRVATLFLPSDAFAHFWSVAEGTNGSARRSISFKLNPGGQNILSVTEVVLFDESIPELPAVDGPSGLHPVVVELRDMHEKLVGTARSILVGFYILLVILIVQGVLRWLGS